MKRSVLSGQHSCPLSVESEYDERSDHRAERKKVNTMSETNEASVQSVVMPWRNDKPPNEIWVQVKDGDSVVEAMAFYGRDGYRPHWRLRDESCCHPSRFSLWR